METVLEELIKGTMCANSRRVHECNVALCKAVENPQNLTALCGILVSPREPQVRQQAAFLMMSPVLQYWQEVPHKLQEEIKSCVFRTLIEEKHRGVWKAVVQLTGTLMCHEAANKDSSWLADLQAFSSQRCTMADPKESELGALIFSKMAEFAPDYFHSQLSEAFELFSGVLVAAQANGDMATPTIAEMMLGMCYLIPLVGDHTGAGAEQTLANIVPLMLSALQAFVKKEVQSEFTNCFDLLNCMIQFVPKLLNKSIKDVFGFCLELLSNKQIDTSYRVELLYIVGPFVCAKKRLITKAQLLKPILDVIFEIITYEFNNDEGNDNIIGKAATRALDLMALRISSEKLLPALLPIIDPALQHPDPLLRRAAIVSIAVIAEGCSKAIQLYYMEIMVNIIQSGVIDQDFRVRSASFFALGEFVRHLHPEIAAFAPKIFPVLLDNIHQMVVEQKTGPSYATNNMTLVFYALQDFCGNLEEKIVPLLPVLMDRLFEWMDQGNDRRIRELALCSIASVASASKSHFLPYLNPMMDILGPYLVYDCAQSEFELRIEAIDALGSIARYVGHNNFAHLAQGALQFSLTMLERGPDDPDLRRAIYNLLGGISIVRTENISTLYPTIIDRMFQTLLSSSSPSSVDEENADVENDYALETEEVILTFKDFAVNSSKSFLPYLTMALEAVYINIDHVQDDICTASVEALCALVISLGDNDYVMHACSIIIPKFVYLIKNDKQQGVVCMILEELGYLFRAVKKAALPKAELAETVVEAITDLLLKKTVCQYLAHCDEPMEEDDAGTEESELDKGLSRAAVNLVASIGHALDPDAYSVYFGRLYYLLLTKLAKAKKNNDPDQCCLLYGVLARCIQPLDVHVVPHFDALCSVFLEGTTECQHKARQDCFFSLGQLVYQAAGKSFGSFPVILQALCDAIARETDALALDYICGALACLIVTNCHILPLCCVLPIFMCNLPLREFTKNYDMVVKAFHALYVNARLSVVPFIGQMAAVTLQVLANKQLGDNEFTASAVFVLKQIWKDYPDEFNNVVSWCMSAEVFAVIENLLN